MHTLGIDLGTSGVRSVVLGERDEIASSAAALAEAQRHDPAALWQAVAATLDALDLSGVRGIAVAGTSGTLVPIDGAGSAIGPLSLYNAEADAQTVALIERVAPEQSAARGGSSALARAIRLQALAGVRHILHEADWIAGQLCGMPAYTDENNALKTGYDPVGRVWPAWIGRSGMRRDLLPPVLPAGTIIRSVINAASARFGLPREAAVVAGTTDGCASFLSTGSREPGDAVTSLGSTLTLKLVSNAPVFAPAHGVYSHRLLGHWLAGGASNSGGAVLAHYFPAARLEALSAQIDPARASGCDLYPLLRPGERFPVSDPAMPPRVHPRAIGDAAFLHGLLEGIARIEALGYRRLTEFGAPPVARVLTVGGGAANSVWTEIRARILGVPVQRAAASSAAHGAAVLARDGLRRGAASRAENPGA